MMNATFAQRKRSLQIGGGLILLSHLLIRIDFEILVLSAGDLYGWRYYSAYFLPRIAAAMAIVSAALLLFAWGRKADKIGLIALLFFIVALANSYWFGIYLWYGEP